MPRVFLRAAAAALLALAVAPAAHAVEFKFKVSRSEYGIPHIKARDYASLAYGYAQALAKDDICVIAEAYVTTDAERSRFFGPDESYPIRGNGSTANNLNSDFFYKAIIDSGRVERLLDEEPPLGPKPELAEGVRGYVAGYNDHLEEIGGPDGISDPACKGAEWVRPIDEMTVYRRFHSLALLASSGVAIDGIAGAQPLVGAAESVDARSLRPGEIDERLSGLGSNAVALGRDATRSGHGMVYGNPHFPWEGPERFYQSHLTIPGKVNVAGGSLIGVPVINIGWTDGLAWSHTVSTARRFVPYELELVPGSPTTYIHDGRPREMTGRTVTVQARTAEGGLEPRSRTLYSSHHGPILTGILGLPIFPWTPERAYALHDANVDNFGRLLNHFFDFNRAQTVGDAEAILKKYVGIPWVNTIVADSKGDAYYADIGSIPHVTDEKLAQCSTALGIVLDQAQRVPVLDGSTSACEPGTDADAPAPGIFGPGNLPALRRDDYTSNMNDSYWLTNPRAPIEGYPRIVGDERTARSLRTRGGIGLIEEGLEERFTLDSLREAAMSNRVTAAELFKDEAVAMCRQMPFVPSSSGPVSTAGACDALEGFDGRDDLDSPGAVLFRRFATKVLAPVVVVAPPVWTVPFSPDDPVNTPRGLNTALPTVQKALGDAIDELKAAGLDLAAPLRGVQYEMRGEERMPIHGGPHSMGLFNVITATWNGKDYGDIVHGSSYVQAVELTPGCPRAHTILTYSQSMDPTSEHYADMTRLYGEKGWVTPPFCKEDMARLRGVAVARSEGLLRSVRIREGDRPRIRVELRRAGRVRLVARRGKQRRVVARRVKGSHRALRLGLHGGTWRLRVTARSGGERDAVSFRVKAR